MPRKIYTLYMVSILDKKTEMNLCYLTLDRYKDFYNFEVYADTGQKNLEKVVKRFKSLVLDNPLLEDKLNPSVLIACNNENKIIGKLICRPIEFYFKEKRQRGFYYCDFFVHEEFRSIGIGKLLVETALKKSKPAFIYPVSQTSMNVAISQGFKVIGHLKKFLQVENLGSFSKLLKNSFFSNCKSTLNLSPDVSYVDKFPSSIAFKNYTFNKVKVLDYWRDYICDPNGIEFARTYDFLKWRISIGQNLSHFYISKDFNLPAYFMCKISFFRGLNVLEVIDYKTLIGDKHAFSSILKASRLLVRELKLDGILIASAHDFFDRLLHQKLFIKGGKPMYLLTTFGTEFSVKLIEERNFLYATMTDL